MIEVKYNINFGKALKTLEENQLEKLLAKINKRKQIEIGFGFIE